MCALGLAANGAKVVIGARRHEVLDNAIKIHAKSVPEGSLIPLELDVTDPRSVEAGLAWIKKEFGELSVLVNNAGGGTARVFEGDLTDIDDISKKRLEVSPEKWMDVFKLNVAAIHTVSAAALPLLAAGNANHGPDSSSIINIAQAFDARRTVFCDIQYIQSGRVSPHDAPRRRVRARAHPRKGKCDRTWLVFDRAQHRSSRRRHQLGKGER